MDESKKTIATALLKSISAGTSHHIGIQLGGLTFPELELLKELFSCKFHELKEKVWAHKHGTSRSKIKTGKQKNRKGKNGC